MTPPPPIQIRVERRIAASAARIYDAWLDPSLAARFLFATPNGRMRSVDIDARVGGSFRIVETRNGEEAEHFGVWLELERPRRLVFAFSIERADPDADRVTIDIIDEGDACRVILTHEMDAEWAAYSDKTKAGWTHILGGLDSALVTNTKESTT
jgi:uncharacterized protein YndB with AHSA1/START domain